MKTQQTLIEQQGAVLERRRTIHPSKRVDDCAAIDLQSTIPRKIQLLPFMSIPWKNDGSTTNL